MKVMTPWRAAMKAKMGLRKPPERGKVTTRKRKRMMKTAIGIKSFGSDWCEFKHETMEVVKQNIRRDVATNSVIAAFHICISNMKKSTHSLGLNSKRKNVKSEK